MKSFRLTIISSLIPCFLLFLWGCGGEENNGASSINHSPEISSLVANPDSVSVDLGQISNLTVTATDPDGDVLECSWSTTAGTLDTIGGTTVQWTAPDYVVQSVVTVIVSDGDKNATASCTFTYDNFAALVGEPSISEVEVVPGHCRVVSPATQEQWWLELYSKVADAGDASSEIIWLTAEPLMEGGTAYYLRDDGDGADYVAGDNEFWARPGGGSMEVQLGSVRFIATNKYLKVDTAYYDLTFKCDSLPTIIVPDTNNGEYISDIIYGYFSGTPTFQWSPFEGAEYYRVALTDTFYHFYVNQEDTLNQNPNLIFWQPSDSLAGTDTCVLYNYDNSASILQLQNYDFTEAEYIFHLTAYQNNAWARREIKVRRVTQD